MNTLKKRRTSVLIGLALMGLSVNAYAADVTATADTPTTAASTEVNGAPESHVINVTANRMALLNLDTPAAMDVITDKDIMNSGAKNAFDAVNMVPGITSFSYGASGLEYGAMDSRVNIRGLERGSLILVNGVPMNLNGKGGLSSIPTGSIARIEVLKGAASALYGSDAMSGVVNVITKTPTKEGGSATIGVGNMGSQTYKINYGTPRFLPCHAQGQYEQWHRSRFHVGAHTPDAVPQRVRYPPAQRALQLALEQEPSSPSAYALQ